MPCCERVEEQGREYSTVFGERAQLKRGRGRESFLGFLGERCWVEREEGSLRFWGEKGERCCVGEGGRWKREKKKKIGFGERGWVGGRRRKREKKKNLGFEKNVGKKEKEKKKRKNDKSLTFGLNWVFR